MANEPISALTLLTSYSTADEIEILDVSDTTFASTGTNKRIPFSTLLTMAGVGSVAGGGTGLTSAGSADQILGTQHVGGGLEYKTLTAGANITSTPGAGEITIAASGSGGGGGSGTVTSVGLTVPSWFTVTGSPITGSGTLAVTAASGQTQNQFLATPNGASGAVGLRSIVAADLPTTGLTITQHSGTITTDTESAGAVTCNLATSDWHLVVLNANVSLSISNPTVGQQFVLVFQQAPSGGPYSISSWFSGTINWMGSPYTAPSMPATASAYLAVTFKCISSGVYLAWWTGNSNV